MHLHTFLSKCSHFKTRYRALPCFASAFLTPFGQSFYSLTFVWFIPSHKVNTAFQLRGAGIMSKHGIDLKPALNSSKTKKYL